MQVALSTIQPALGSSTVQISRQAALRGRLIGVSILAGFGCLWLAGGFSGLGAGLAAYLTLAVVTAAIILAARRLADTSPVTGEALRTALREDPQQIRRMRTFHWINGAQWTAAIALIVTLNVIHHPEWIAAGIMLIVGLHFLPLARLFDYRGHLLLGIAVSSWAIAYPMILATGPASPWGPIVAGLMLWTSAVTTLVVAARSRVNASNR